MEGQIELFQLKGTKPNIVDQKDQIYQLTFIKYVPLDKVVKIDEDLSQADFYKKYNMDNRVWSAVRYGGSPEIYFALM